MHPLGSSITSDAAVEVRPLERLSSAVDRLNNVDNQLANFINRFRANNKPAESTPEAGCYEALINSLFVVVESLERRVDEIGNIG